MNISAQNFSQPFDVLFSSLSAHGGTALISGYYTRATLLHLIQRLETLAFGSNAGAMIVSSTFPFRCYHHDTVVDETALVRRLSLALNDDVSRSDIVCCILGAACSAILCAKALDGTEGDDNVRPFEVLWSVDPAIVSFALDLLEQHLAQTDPDQHYNLQYARQDFPLHQLTPELTLRLSADIISFDAHQHNTLTAKMRDLETRLRWHEDQTRMMVHDIRAPLHTLLISIKSLLRQQFGSSGQEELLQMAYESAQALHDLTTTATDALRLEAGRMPLNYQELNIETLVRSVCEPFELDTSDTQPHMYNFVDSELPVVWGDRGLLERVLTNLVSNAVKYTPPTGEIVVTAQLATDGQTIELTVGDTGKGIALEEQPYIFERFYQTKGSDRRRGLGIGLYFCRVAVEAHGGTISLASTPGVGSIFKVILPLAQAQQAVEAVAS